MSDLERIVAVLVRIVESRFPSRLSTGFRIEEIYDSFIPYRAHRMELGVETNEDYELALTRLLSGEGDFLSVPEDVSAALRKEIASVSPDTGLYRSFGLAEVTLTQNALLLSPPPGTVKHKAATQPAEPARAIRSGKPGEGEEPRMATTPRTTDAAALGGRCRYCSGKLPEGRPITYCPHCGQDLTVLHCPACSAVLEVGWHFCVACGRNVGEDAG